MRKRTKTSDQSAPTDGSAADADAWLKTDQVAAEFGYAVETVRRWIRDGAVPASRVPGGRGFRVRRSDVRTFLNQEQPSSSRLTGDELESSVAVPGERTRIIRD